MTRMLLLAMTLLLAGCVGSLTPPPISLKSSTPPHPSVQVELRVVDPDVVPNAEWKGQSIALRRRSLISSADVVDVSVAHGDDYPAINFTFSKEAGARLRQATPELIMQRVAMTVNGQVLTVAMVSGPFADTMQVRSPDATLEQTTAVARYITEGGPPALLP